MTDRDQIKDVLEIAELLSSESEDVLEVVTVNRKTDEVVTVIFNFNSDGELTEIVTED